MGQSSSKSLPPNAIVGQMPPIPHEDTTGWEYLYHIPLDQGHEYRIVCWQQVCFSMTGGSCGSFTLNIGPSAIPLVNIHGHGIHFCQIEPGTRITVQDNPSRGGSSVIVTRGGTSGPTRPIPIRAEVNQGIYIDGDRDFNIIGNGRLLVHNGSGVVTVNGDLQCLHQGGISNIYLHLIQNDGVVAQNGLGTVIVEGDVETVLRQEGCGTIEVKGDVKGYIYQIGCGSIFVRGRHVPGPVLLTKSGRGIVQIDG